MNNALTLSKAGELAKVSQEGTLLNKEKAPIQNRFPASLPKPWLDQWNESLEEQSPIARIEWTMENLPSQFVVSSSFGIQSLLCCI